jgi:hypothetical protein
VADRADRQAFLGVGEPSPVGQHREGRQQAVEVVERFAHAHEHQRVGPAVPGGQRHLRDDLAGGEVAQQAEPAGLAERAGARAADLRRHAEAGPAASHRQVHALDGEAVGQPQQPLVHVPVVARFVLFGGELRQGQGRQLPPRGGGAWSGAELLGGVAARADGGGVHGEGESSALGSAEMGAGRGVQGSGGSGQQVEGHRQPDQSTGDFTRSEALTISTWRGKVEARAVAPRSTPRRHRP